MLKMLLITPLPASTPLFQRKSQNKPGGNINFNFLNFFSEYESHISANLPSKSFLSWLIGFSEGDGSFTFSRRGDLSFVISQDTRDI